MSSTLSIRINPKTKKAAQKIFRKFGLNMSTAIKLFLNQVIATQSISFLVADKSKTIGK